ncbi:MAG TPA: DUF2269 domain-containing protein [Candidatus Thermoplasmatota archaeon]|jgi:hypothetical protein|nr:DUF2269 domain-containing protein [Candidatus Thermoplasmatota archaeon]
MLGVVARKVLLVAHILVSVGWMGALAAFIALDVTTAVGLDADVARACYIAMDIVTRYAIVPLAIATLASGIVVSLGTRWGLFRHYWVVVSLVLTVLSTVVLAVQIPLIAHRADVAQSGTDVEVLALGNLLLHSIGGAVVLLVVLVLNVVKPRGLTRYGWRREARDQARRKMDASTLVAPQKAD